MEKVTNSQKRVPKGDIKFSLDLTTDQKVAKAGMYAHSVCVLLGKAGTGKTQVATLTALDMYFKRDVNRIIITRPMVATEDIGYLPGTKEEKIEPYLAPVKDCMREGYQKDKIQKMFSDGVIEVVPIAYTRGITYKNAFVIIDEVQNMTLGQLEMCLSRLGKGSKIVLCGDHGQIDLKRKQDSCIHHIHKLGHLDDVFTMVLKTNHRHELVEDLISALNM